MTPAEPPPWQWDLARAADRLGRGSRQARALPAPDDLVVPAEQLLTDDAALLRLIRSSIPADLPPLPPGHADRFRTDPRILASRFARLYSNATTGAALIALAWRCRPRPPPARCSIVFLADWSPAVSRSTPRTESSGAPSAPRRGRSAGRVSTRSASCASTWTRYFGEHIAPLFSRIAEPTNVSPKLLWSNSAEMAGLVGDSAEEYLDPAEATPFLADSRALLDAEQLPGVPGRPDAPQARVDATTTAASAGGPAAPDVLSGPLPRRQVRPAVPELPAPADRRTACADPRTTRAVAVRPPRPGRAAGHRPRPRLARPASLTPTEEHP